MVIRGSGVGIGLGLGERGVGGDRGMIGVGGVVKTVPDGGGGRGEVVGGRAASGLVGVGVMFRRRWCVSCIFSVRVPCKLFFFFFSSVLLRSLFCLGSRLFNAIVFKFNCCLVKFSVVFNFFFFTPH